MGMVKRIRKAAVLGSGVMGSGIACHLANIGVEVLLLDIQPAQLSEEEKKSLKVRNSIVDGALQAAIKSKPASLYDLSFSQRIKTGNFEDDFSKISDCDWIIEVVVERLDVKKEIFAQVDTFRRKGSLVSSNTSGIPIHLMSEGRTDDFKKHFCGTHFFNPPRYLRLLEVIPTTETLSDVIQFFLHYGDHYLGKTTVLCKDTPAFIGNRIGVFAMAKVFQLTSKYNLRIEEVDALTGPVVGRPKTGTFRLGDLVGHDTSGNVIRGLKANCGHDEQVSSFEVPPYLEFLLEHKFLGNKSGQGFYKKTGEKDDKGKPVILALNLNTLTYEASVKPDIPSLKAAKQMDDLPRRIRHFFDASDSGAALIKESLVSLFSYASNRIPEIADHFFRIDDAIRAGFAWELGPFEYWDIIGLEKGVQLIEQAGEKVPTWVREMISLGFTSFYTKKEGKRFYYDSGSKAYAQIPGQDSLIILDNYRSQAPVHKTSETILHDIGEGVLCLEFTSPHNSIGEGVLRGIQESIQIAEDGDWKGLVIGNQATNFSVGANLMMIGMLAYQQDYEQLNLAVDAFQQTTMRCRYSAIPVVAATQGYVFGGGCEILMHCDAGVVSAESYIGLVEAGIGVLPGGGGTKEYALRASDLFFEGDVQIPTLIEKFKAIALASVATSAYEGFRFGSLIKGRDEVVLNKDRAIAYARQKVLHLARNYTQPIKREDSTVLGRSGLAPLYLAANELKLGHFASEHDIKIAKKIAYVLCGGDLSGSQQVSEQYLLDVEREAFLSLCGEPKTQERIQYMLQNNKPLRN
jgi:3-hydroxyacyl-CoA dehydrogenase